MGKQVSPKSPHPEVQNEDLLLEMKEYEPRSLETENDPPIGINDCPNYGNYEENHVQRRHIWLPKHLKSIALMFVIIGFIFLLDSLMVSMDLRSISAPKRSSGIKNEENRDAYAEKEKLPEHMYDRLLNLASSALLKKEFKQEYSNFWEEPYQQASAWKPCADRKVSTSLGRHDQNNGYILVSANGGLNQQRVAICNAVAVASLLNATLVLPRFLYSNVWKDPSQFGDIYQEEHFIKIMKDEVDIVKELPPDLKSVDIEALGSLITDADLVKEAKPIDHLRIVLPLLLRNRVIHFLGFGHRLGFDPLPFELQFDGGETERSELQAYREAHFPLLIERLKNSKPVSSMELRKLGRCPLTPEEAALVLAGLGFRRGTYIYLAGSHIYGGKSKMSAFTSLYSNLVTKETLLTPNELAPFQNFSSQLAALDFIACATSDVFSMTDTGSQFSSLVTGFRTYHGGGHAPTLRPNKKRLAAIFSENSTIEWNRFEERVKKMFQEGQGVRVRGFGKSIYQQPRCPECMCKSK